MTDSQPARRYRFGVFEVDTAAGEIRRQGLRIKLNAQPFQVLCMLLERHGELLTREEISQELWPDGTFVDYEHGMNAAVNRIRDALGDAASNPRYVETLARRGYRFVAPVERIVEGETATAIQADTAETSALVAKAKRRILATAEELPAAPYRVVRALFILLQLMYLGFYVGSLLNLPEIEDLFAALPKPELVLNLLIVSAAILIPVRVFVLCALAFRAPRRHEKLLTMWPFVLPFDLLWALSPFLLLHHIRFGPAVACIVLLVYSPFAQRSLILMGASGPEARDHATTL